jgi:hypothetical protein
MPSTFSAQQVEALYPYADETADYLDAAVLLVMRIKHISLRAPAGTPAEAAELNRLAKELHEAIDAAGTAANTLWGEVQSL